MTLTSPLMPTGGAGSLKTPTTTPLPIHAFVVGVLCALTLIVLMSIAPPEPSVRGALATVPSTSAVTKSPPAVGTTTLSPTYAYVSPFAVASTDRLPTVIAPPFPPPPAVAANSLECAPIATAPLALIVVAVVPDVDAFGPM